MPDATRSGTSPACASRRYGYPVAGGAGADAVRCRSCASLGLEEWSMPRPECWWCRSTGLRRHCEPPRAYETVQGSLSGGSRSARSRSMTTSARQPESILSGGARRSVRRRARTRSVSRRSAMATARSRCADGCSRANWRMKRCATSSAATSCCVRCSGAPKRWGIEICGWVRDDGESITGCTRCGARIYARVDTPSVTDGEALSEVCASA